MLVAFAHGTQSLHLALYIVAMNHTWRALGVSSTVCALLGTGRCIYYTFLTSSHSLELYKLFTHWITRSHDHIVTQWVVREKVISRIACCREDCASWWCEVWGQVTGLVASYWLSEVRWCESRSLIGLSWFRMWSCVICVLHICKCWMWSAWYSQQSVIHNGIIRSWCSGRCATLISNHQQ